MNMEKISDAASLKRSIEILKAEQETKRQLLQTQFYNTMETVKPINLMKGLIHDISSTPILTQNILGTASGMASSFLLRRFMPGSTAGLISRLVGTAIHYGITRASAKTSGIMHSVTHGIRKLFSKHKLKDTDHHNS
jgi:hypothetical protein